VVDDPIDLSVRAALAGGGSFFLVEGRERLGVPSRCLAMPFGGDIVGRYQKYELKWLVKSDLCHPKNSVVCTGILWYKSQNSMGCTGFRVGTYCTQSLRAYNPLPSERTEGIKELMYVIVQFVLT
jgi:hypothetical protein